MHPCVFHNDSAKVRKIIYEPNLKRIIFRLFLSHHEGAMVHGARCANWPDIYEKYFR